jgi:hypothetical protein
MESDYELMERDERGKEGMERDEHVLAYRSMLLY